MAYNNGREDRKWRIWKEAEEKVLREHGVDEATIEQIRIDDRADFNSNRRFYHWTSDFGEYLEGMADREQSAEVKTVEDLLDEIEDENLYQALLRKLDEITTQVRYMSEHNISTLSDLHADREKNQTEMDRLTNYRRHLQNKIRRASPAEKETLREEKNGVTERITELRKRLKYADGIEKRSAHIDDCLNQIHDTVENQRSNQNGRTDRKREDALR